MPPLTTQNVKDNAQVPANTQRLKLIHVDEYSGLTQDIWYTY
jgi:hypothetical protein